MTEILFLGELFLQGKAKQLREKTSNNICSSVIHLFIYSIINSAAQENKELGKAEMDHLSAEVTQSIIC